MSTTHTFKTRRPGHCAITLAIVAAGMALTATAQTGKTADKSQLPDAVYELWEQDWTLNADGSIVYREKTHIRLNSDRTFRAFGDPRITYNADNQEVKVITARTRLPNGKYVELADYSTVEVAPDAAGGWPAFGGLRQRVLVMGGIEPGCVLENEFVISTKAGVRPYLAADLRIDNRYPVRSRTITVTIPTGAELSPVIGGLGDDDYLYTFQQSSDKTTHRWLFAGLPGHPHEPQSLPWYETGVRLAFTTAPNAENWIKQRLADIDAAADESPLLSKLAEQWTGDSVGAADKLKALQDELAKTFNFINFGVAWRPARPRNASEVIRHNYGLPEEAAAVMLSLARAAGIAARPALLVADGLWQDGAPQAAMVSEYVLAIDDGDALEIWHPRHGRIQRNKRWAGYTLLTPSNDRIVRSTLPAWTNADASRIEITGVVTIGKDGKFAGDLSIRTSGLFVSPGDLETRDRQKRRVEAIVGHVLPAAKVSDFTLTTLAPGLFNVQARIASDGKLDQTHGCYELELAKTDPAFADVPVPLARSQRRYPTRIAGPFDENIELRIAWPDGWTTSAIPADVRPSAGQWGEALQTAKVAGAGLTISRHVRMASRDLAPADVTVIRDAINAMRTTRARTLLLRP